MNMRLAVNYSAATAGLLAAGEIAFDTFKCPAWPDLIATARAQRPVNVHFPLLVGSGSGEAIDGETGQPADWRKIETLLASTGTPLINVHLLAPAGRYPGVSLETVDPAHVEQVTEHLIRDVAAVVRRFGAERVIAENNPPHADECLRPAYLPGVITRVIQETGCGLLLDLAHVRLAARALEMDARRYTQALPIERLREIHVTGVQRIEGGWIDRMRQNGVTPDAIQRLAGQLTDHLPMMDEDWGLFDWAMVQVRSGAWHQPWIVTFEYGGVGALWEAVTDEELLRVQVPRLYRAVSGG